MKDRFYLDTCIWIDLFENRIDKYRPLGEFAKRLVKKIFDNNGLILYSDTILQEIMSRVDSNILITLFRPLQQEGLIRRVMASDQQIAMAISLSKFRNIPCGDALHAILARDNDAFLVTRDKHFRRLKDIVKILKPEDLL